jgi:hypothetical protein
MNRRQANPEADAEMLIAGANQFSCRVTNGLSTSYHLFTLEAHLVQQPNGAAGRCRSRQPMLTQPIVVADADVIADIGTIDW